MNIKKIFRKLINNSIINFKFDIKHTYTNLLKNNKKIIQQNFEINILRDKELINKLRNDLSLGDEIKINNKVLEINHTNINLKEYIFITNKKHQNCFEINEQFVNNKNFDNQPNIQEKITNNRKKIFKLTDKIIKSIKKENKLKFNKIIKISELIRKELTSNKYLELRKRGIYSTKSEQFDIKFKYKSFVIEYTRYIRGDVINIVDNKNEKVLTYADQNHAYDGFVGVGDIDNKLSLIKLDKLIDELIINEKENIQYKTTYRSDEDLLFN